MSRRRMMTLTAALALGMLAALGCGDDPVEPVPSSLFAPESWAGVWQVTLTSRECGGDSVIGVDILPDSVCTGESLVDFLGLSDEDVQLDCRGTWNDDQLSANCTGTSEALGCDLDIWGSIDATLDTADSFGGSLRIQLRFNCDDVSDDCIDAEMAAVRLGPEPETCPTQPVAGALGSLLGRAHPQH